MTSSRSKPRTLLLTLVFPPDGVSTANLLGELVDRLSERGHDMTVVTTTPHYNEDAELLAAQPLRRKWPLVLFESRRNRTAVYHARMRRKTRRILTRLIDYAVFHIIGTFAALRLGGKYDVVLAPSPPLTIGLQAAFLARLRGVPFIYNVQEIFPDLAVTLGVLKNRTLIAFFEGVERFVYQRSKYVVVISDRFRDTLQRKGVPSGKLRVIPNFVDTESMTPRAQANDFALEHGLAGRFVVLYAGNLGLTQDFPMLLAAAAQLTDIEDFVLLIVGDGARRAWLIEEIARRNIRNVRLLPYQPKGRVPDMYATSSVCVVPLIAGTAHDTFPSKIYTIMAAGRAAIVTADTGSELADTVSRAQCGVSLATGDVDGFVAAVRDLHRDRQKLETLATHGRDYVVRHHSAEAIAKQYDELLREVTSPR